MTRIAVIKPRRKLFSHSDPVVGRPAVGAGPGGEVGGKAAEGTYLTFAMAPESQERKDFEKTYKKMWKVESIGSYAYYAYDAAMIYMKAVKNANTTDTKKIADTLRNTPWSGVTGTIKFDDKGDRKLAHVIWIVKDGKFVPYWDPLNEKYF